MEQIKELVISRSIWLRGGPEGESKLLRTTDNKMCCLGIYLEACGIAKDQLEDVETPANMDPGQEIPVWLLEDDLDPDDSSPVARELMMVNDDSNVSEEKREDFIASEFEKQGIKVTFTD